MHALCTTKPSGLLLLIPGAWLLLLVCSAALLDSGRLSIVSQCSAEETPAVSVERSVFDKKTTYCIRSKDCAIEWIVRDSEAGVIKHSSRCAAPLAEQLPLLEKICVEFFSKDKNAQAFRTLFWGTLDPDTRIGSRELSLRLALAAYKSPGWDAKRGKPKNGDINGFVRDIANREMIFPELKELFARFHKNIKFSCAEKVLVLKAEKLPFFDRLKQQGVKAADKLPFDCMTWFSVSEIF